MSNGNYVTNTQLFEKLENLEAKIETRVLRIEEKVEDNTNWRNKITGQFTVLMIFIGLGINWIWDKVTGQM